MALLEVKGLKTFFFLHRGVVKAADEVSFSVEQGQTLGLVGESGSGKTVTCLSILRLVPEPAGRIVSGQIFFNGTDLLSLSQSDMRRYRGRRISMVFQDPLTSLNPVFPIGSQIIEAITTHQRPIKKRIAWQRATEMLRLLGISSPESRMEQFPHQLSGGMRQRVVSAVSLACQPQLLIADEPTTSLDVTVQAQYLDLLREIQREQKLTIIFVTHDFGIVAEMCNQVAVMYAGKIVEMTDVRELFNNPLHPYTRALMKSVPTLEKNESRLASIKGQPPDLCNLNPGCAFLPRCIEGTQKCLVQEPVPGVTLHDNHLVRCWNYV